MIEDAYIARVAERAATDAAFKLATKGPEMVVNGRREEVWRARPDGVVELVRAHCGRVELLEVLGDGTSLLVATSPRSIRKIAMTICEYAAFVSFVVGCLGSIFAPGGGFTVLLALALLLFPLSFLLGWKSRVRPWVRSRFGSDAGWANVPWKIHGGPTTGNQAIALSALAGGSTLRYRVRDDGTLEVVSRGKQVEVLAVDRLGVATVTEILPSKRFKLDDLREHNVTWYTVFGSDPSGGD